MTALVETLLAEVQAVGGELVVNGPDQITVRAPAPLPDDLMARLRAAKPELLATLGRPCPEPERATWTAADWCTYYDERAGIVELDGKVSRAKAERSALETCIVEWLRQHPARSDPQRCAWCGEADRPSHTWSCPSAPRIPGMSGSMGNAGGPGTRSGAPRRSRPWPPWGSPRRGNRNERVATP